MATPCTGKRNCVCCKNSVSARTERRHREGRARVTAKAAALTTQASLGLPDSTSLEDSSDLARPTKRLRAGTSLQEQSLDHDSRRGETGRRLVPRHPGGKGPQGSGGIGYSDVAGESLLNVWHFTQL